MNHLATHQGTATVPSGLRSTLATHRVLRNTYWLLALSLLPTVLGAWIGVSTGITRSLSGGLGLMVFLGGAFGFMYAIEKTKNSAAGVPVLLAFTFFMGLMLSRLIGAVLGFSNGAGLIMTAFTGTGLVFFGMATLSTVIKRDLTSMGKWLFIGVIMLLAREGFESEEISDFAGLNQRSPLYAGVMAVCMFSLAGIPPLVGFYAKLAVLQALVSSGQTSYLALAVFAVMMSLIGAFYYLRVVKLMYFDAPTQTATIEAPLDVRVVLTCNGALVLLLGILPGGLMDATIEGIWTLRVAVCSPVGTSM